MPTVPNLPNFNFFVGDVDLNGWYYLYSLGENGIIYVIYLNVDSPNYLKLIDSATGNLQNNAPYGIVTTQTSFADWTFNPIDGQLYAGITNTNIMVRIDPITGVQTQLNTTELPNNSLYSAAFFDTSEVVYVINNTTGNVYRIVISGNNATASLFSQAEPTFLNDGTRCTLLTIDAISIEKTVDLSEVSLNSILTYTITVKNTAIVQLTDVVVKDIIPEGVTLVNGSVKLNGNAITGDITTGINIGTLDSNSIAIITFEVLVNDNIPEVNPIINTATVSFNKN